MTTSRVSHSRSSRWRPDLLVRRGQTGLAFDGAWYFGRGLIKDDLKPGWLIRILNKIF